MIAVDAGGQIFVPVARVVVPRRVDLRNDVDVRIRANLFEFTEIVDGSVL